MNIPIHCVWKCLWSSYSYPVSFHCGQNILSHTDLSRNLVNIIRAAKERLTRKGERERVINPELNLHKLGNLMKTRKEEYLVPSIWIQVQKYTLFFHTQLWSFLQAPVSLCHTKCLGEAVKFVEQSNLKKHMLSWEEFIQLITSVPLQWAYGIVMIYSSSRVRNNSLAFPSSIADREFPGKRNKITNYYYAAFLFMLLFHRHNGHVVVIQKSIP